MINYKNFIKSTFILFIFLGIFFNLVLITQNNNYSNLNNKNYLKEENLIDIRTSQNGKKALNYSSITRNNTIIYRFFDSIKFTVNVSGFDDVKYTYMQIDFSNRSVGQFNMSFIETDIYSYVYSPKSFAPLEFQNVSFLIYNLLDEVVNAHTTYTNFTIKSNYVAGLNSYEHNRGNFVDGTLYVDDHDVYDFNWNVTVVDSISESSQVNLFNLGNNIQHFSFQIDDRFTQPDKVYYVKINMSDDSPSKKIAAYVPFKVLNSIPQISESSVNFSLQEFKRDEDCHISLNVSDADPTTRPGYLNVSLVLITSIGQKETPYQLSNNKDWTFDGTFSIDINKPIGFYQAILKVKDQYGGESTYNETLNIKNNPPEIHEFWINGRGIEESIAINYGDDIIFTFNISDVENTIAYVTVSLLDENDNWHNESKVYSDGMTLLIRSVDLITGVWYVYISATDEDGDTTYITSDFGLGPKEIRIIPDELTPLMPLIMLITGLVLGILAGIVFSYRRVKSKFVERQPMVTKKKEIVTKKKKIKPPKEKITEEEIEEIEPEEEPEKKPPQRKIKRKLK
ncbi:MAG: hypothetical protein ACFFBZ_11190 [Promethearchaeota archaeon]